MENTLNNVFPESRLAVVAWWRLSEPNSTRLSRLGLHTSSSDSLKRPVAGKSRVRRPKRFSLRSFLQAEFPSSRSSSGAHDLPGLHLKKSLAGRAPLEYPDNRLLNLSSIVVYNKIRSGRQVQSSEPSCETQPDWSEGGKGLLWSFHKVYSESELDWSKLSPCK